jgi:hypothetical protein
MADEGIGIAVASGEGARDAAHLPSELEVILKGPDAVGVREGDGEDAEKEGCPEDEAGRTDGFRDGFRGGQRSV